MSLLNETPSNAPVNNEIIVSKSNEHNSINELNQIRKPDEVKNMMNRSSQPKTEEKMDVDQSDNQSEQTNRVLLSDVAIVELTKDELVKKWKQQNDYIDRLEQKLKLELSNKEMYQENEEKIKQQLFDLTRKENLLVMKLTTKEHEVQDYIKQIQELKLSQIALNDQLKNSFLDPAVNMIFEEMKKEVEKSKLKVEEMQSDLSAWKFTPDSNTGKRLMAKCRLLYQENEELGKVISSGRVAKLEGELSLLKNFSEEMKKSQEEIDDFLFELDEDVEGMQSTIYHLQKQLKEAKDNLQKYQLREENQTKDEFNSPDEDKQSSNNNESNNEKQKYDKSDSEMEESKNVNLNNFETSEVKNDNLNSDSHANNSDTNPNLNEESVVEEVTNSTQKNGDKSESAADDSKLNQISEEKSNCNLERKRSLDEALEEMNAKGLMSDCGIDSIIKKHRKLEQEKSENLLKNS